MPAPRTALGSRVAVDQQLVFTSLSHAARAFKLAMRPELEREQLTTPMFWALHELAHDGTMSVGAIAAACVVTSANISGAVEELVEAGLAERSTSPKDRRVAMLAATPKGRALHRTIWARAAQRFSAPLEGVPRADLEATGRVLERLAAATASEVDLPRGEP